MNEDDLVYVATVLDSREFFRYSSEAHHCSDVEHLISSYMDNTTSSILVSNGTAAIKVLLKAIGVNMGDYVAVNAFTFVATANAVYSIGAIPIPIDFDPKTNLSLEDLSNVLKHKPAAVIAVHWPGRCFDLKPVNDFCIKHNIPLIEDACQAFAAKTGEKKAGLQGCAGVFSFQQNKLVSCGEGGCIITNDNCLMERISQYIDHGMSRLIDGTPTPEWLIPIPGENLRLTEIQAALLKGQIKKIDNLLQNLSDGQVNLSRELSLNGIEEWSQINPEHLGQVATFLFSDRESAYKAQEYAFSQNIMLKPIWAKPFYQCYNRGVEPRIKKCSVAEAVASRVRIVPTPPNIEENTIKKIVSVMNVLRPTLVQHI